MMIVRILDKRTLKVEISIFYQVVLDIVERSYDDEIIKGTKRYSSKFS